MFKQKSRSISSPVEVTRDNRSLFQYPASHDPTTLAWSDGAVQIFIAGAKSHLATRGQCPVLANVGRNQSCGLSEDDGKSPKIP